MNNFFTKTILLLFLLGVCLQQIHAQCTANTSWFPPFTINVGTGSIVTIATNNYEGEYAQVTGIVSGARYKFTINNASSIITVRIGSSNGAVLGFGTASVTVTATSTSDLYVHFNTSSCTNTTNNRTTTVQGVPTITSLGTTNACTGGSITINGTNFNGVTASNVTIGGTAVSAITTLSATQIVATVGNGTTGLVTVTNSAGSNSSAATFTVSAAPINKTISAVATTVCSNSGTNIQVANSEVGVNYQLRNNTGNVNIGSAVAGNGGIINLSTGNLSSNTTFNVLATKTSGGCTLQMTGTVTVSVGAPTVTPGSALSACSSLTPAAITLTGSSVGGTASTGAWAIVSGGGTLSSTAQTATPATVTYTPADAYTGTVVLSLTTNTPSGCSAANATRNIVINPKPVPVITANHCIGGGVVRLTCNTQTSYLWNLTGQTTQSIDVLTAGNYVVTATNAYGCVATDTYVTGTEFVTNGDFNAGNTGFITNYIYSANIAGNTELYPEGTYGVGADANQYHNAFNGTDHTSGSGNFMIINGKVTADQIVWSQNNIAVTANTTYYFSAWGLTIVSGNNAILRFSINGTQVGTTISLPDGYTNPSGPFNWVRFFGTWNSGASTTANLSIVNLQLAAGGNDFGLDDISFSNLPPLTLVTAPSTNAPICTGTNLNLQANIAYGNYPLTYAWSGPGSYTSTSLNPTIVSSTAANAGVYSLTVTDRYGCTASGSSSTVVVNPLPTITAAATVVAKCFNTNAQTSNLTYTVTTNSPTTYSITWSAVANTAGLVNVVNAALPASPIVVNLPANLAANTYTGTLFVTNANGCISTGTAISLTVNPLPNVTSANAATICSGGTVSIPLISDIVSDFIWLAANNTNITGESTSVQATATLSNTLTNTALTGQDAVYSVTPTASATGCVGTTQIVTIRVETSITNNTIIAAQNICSASIPNTLTGTTPTGGNGTSYTYSWEASTTSASTGFSTASGTSNIQNYSPAALTQTTWYRRVVNSGTCTNTSSVIAITVDAVIANNTITTSQSVCSGAAVATLAGTTPTGGNNVFTYAWESSTTNASAGFSSASGTNNAQNYSPTSVTQTTWFRRVITSGACSSTSTAVQITVSTIGQWLGTISTDWNVAGNWCGGVPTASTNVLIPSGATVNIQTANAVANSVTISSGASLVMTGTYNLTITAGGTFTNNGTYTASSSTGTILFNGSGVISGVTTFQNIDTKGALNFGTSSTVNGAFTIQTGGSVTGNAPTYICPASTLIYKTGSVFARGIEWATNNTGQGYPSNVIIQSNTTINFPIPGQGYICNDLTIESGSILDQNYASGSAQLQVGRHVNIYGTLTLGGNSGGDLNVGGNWTRTSTGIFNSNDRKVTFDGTGNFSARGLAMSTISAPSSTAKDNEGGFGGEKFAHLWMNKAAATDSLVLLSNITVTRQIGFTKGTFCLRNSDVTIVSNATRTADVAPITTIANVAIRYAGTGKFVIQRFVQNPTATRSWRLLTAPVQSATAPTINEAYMEGVVNPNRSTPNANNGMYNPWPTYGTHITGAGGAYSAANGFDHGTNSSSILYAGPSVASWLTPTSTISTKITDKPGWMLFVRGDRGFAIGNQYVPAQNTTLEPKGQINIGNVVIPVSVGRQVIGNPYPAAISLLNVDISGLLGKVSNYHMWDPKMFTSYTQPGKWVSFSGLGSAFVKTTSSSNYLLNGTIESGQAFLLDVLANGNITFHESDKLSLTSSLTGIASGVSARGLAEETYPMFRTDIFAKSDSTFTLTDGVLNIFHPSFDDLINDEDAKKFISFNTKESLSVLRDSACVAIEKRGELKRNDTIFYSMTKFNPINYQFKFAASDFRPGYQAFLEDKFTNTKTLVSTSGTTFVNFAITTDSLSKQANRFKVVFQQANVLPVTITKITAVKLNDNTIAVEWNVAQELNISSYYIEKSIDGISYSKVGVENAYGNNSTAASYRWIDKNASNGKNYYRLKALDFDGSFKYSQIVYATINGKSNITIFPNPIEHNTVQLIMSGVVKGKYQIVVLNNAGQLVNTNSFTVLASDEKKSIIINSQLAKGLYNAVITSPDGVNTNIKIAVQ